MGRGGRGLFIDARPSFDELLVVSEQFELPVRFGVTANGVVVFSFDFTIHRGVLSPSPRFAQLQRG